MFDSSNPYLEEFKALDAINGCDLERNIKLFQERDRLVVKYAWAIPNDEAIKTLVEHSPIVEIGCGTGLRNCCEKSTKICENIGKFSLQSCRCI